MALDIGHLPSYLYDVYISTVAKYILRVEIVTGAQLNTMERAFQL